MRSVINQATASAAGSRRRSLLSGLASLVLSGGLATLAAGANPGKYNVLVLSPASEDDRLSLRDLRDNGDAVGVLFDSGPALQGFWRRSNGQQGTFQTLGGSDAQPQAVNARGIVVGASRTGDDRGHACRWADYSAVPDDLGTLGGNSSVALGINVRGEICGTSDTADGGQRAFFRRPGDDSLQPLPIPDGTRFSVANRINDVGVLCGRISVETGQGSDNVPVYWPSRTAQPIRLPLPPGATTGEALDLNNHGVIIGSVVGTGGVPTGVVWRRKSGGRAPQESYGVSAMPGKLEGAFPAALNDAGQIVGLAIVNHRPVAILWTATQAFILNQLLRRLNSYNAEDAIAINNRGQIAVHGDAPSSGGPAQDKPALLTPVNRPAGPDLTGRWNRLALEVEGTGNQQTSHVFGKFTVRNDGTSSAGRFVVRFYLSRDLTWDEDDLQIESRTVNGLLREGRKTFTWIHHFPPGAEVRGLYVIARVDAAAAVVETDESNNEIVSRSIQFEDD